MRRVYGIFLLITILASSCAFLSSNQAGDEDAAVARVGDKYLYRSDLSEIVAAFPSGDSTKIASQYIDKWISTMLLFEKAESNLPLQEFDIDRKVRDYKESLIIYYYEQELIRQKLDTSISRNEVRDYYKEFKSNFELEENIYRTIFLKMMANSRSKDSVIGWFSSSTLEDQSKLENFSSQYAINYVLKDSFWLAEENFLSNVPLKKDDLQKIRPSDKTVAFIDSIYLYMFKIWEVHNEGTDAPLQYVEDDIRKIILNKRKIQLIEDMYQKVYSDGIKQGNFERYD